MAVGAEAGGPGRTRALLGNRAGGRSAQATNILRRAGFNDTANLAGGMLRWRAQGCRVEGGRD